LKLLQTQVQHKQNDLFNRTSPISSASISKIKEVLRTIATPEHPYASLIADLADFQEALASELEDLNEEVAFSARARAMATYKWASQFLVKWPDLCWAVMRISGLGCSASGCEHSWSVEAWIQNKKRNRLSQSNVDRLLRAHTNLTLLSQTEDWESKVLPWDIEMIIDDPEIPEGEEEPEY